MGSCLDSCPKPSLQVPLTPEVAVFRQLRRDGSFRQEPLQLLILSVLFPRLSHRAAKKTLLFLVAIQAVPLFQQLPRSCTLNLAGLILSSRATAREPLCFPMAGRKGKGSGRRYEGLCNRGACSNLCKSPGTKMMHWRSACALPVLPAGLPGASPATDTLYPQN